MKKKIIAGSIILLIFIILGGYYFFKKDDYEDFTAYEEVTTKKAIVENKFYVDVKGAVKDPGVYLVSDGERVIDAISRAGGLKKSASTNNINLSQRLKKEMVVYVYTAKEVENGSTKINCDTSCNCETIEVDNCIKKEENQDKVNINTATLEELLMLSGIGESKAKAIIEYREINGLFKSIEDIKSVNGIGDSLFDKIKDRITV